MDFQELQALSGDLNRIDGKRRGLIDHSYGPVFTKFTKKLQRKIPEA